MTNETLRVIKERYSCRSFKEQMPNKELLDAVALAGAQSPSAMNRQWWQIIVVTNTEILNTFEAEAMRIISCAEDKSAYERIMSRGGKVYYNAPCMVLLAVKNVPQKGMELIDCGIVAQNIVLAATSIGLATVHCGMVTIPFSGSMKDELKSKLGIISGYDCITGVLLGYPLQTKSPHEPDLTKILYVK